MSEQPPEVPEVPDDGEIPGLEEILRISLGITPDMETSITALAAVHARWRKAWADTAAFSDEETFELVRILVASSAGAIRSLGLCWGSSGPEVPAPGHQQSGDDPACPSCLTPLLLTSRLRSRRPGRAARGA